MESFNGTEIAIEELNWAAMLEYSPQSWILGSLAWVWFVANARITPGPGASRQCLLFGMPAKVDPSANPWTVKVEVESL